jgi:hypothetical protein
MSKGNTFENELMQLIFQAKAAPAVPNLMDNAVTSPLTSLYVALHTADPGEGGDQNTSAATYVNYARVAVARNSGGWSVSTNIAQPVADITFPMAGSGTTPQNITHFSVGVASSGATKILYKGAVAPVLAVSENVTPRLTTQTQITED